jgi:hypothetical protein
MTPRSFARDEPKPEGSGKIGGLRPRQAMPWAAGRVVVQWLTVSAGNRHAVKVHGTIAIMIMWNAALGTTAWSA